MSFGVVRLATLFLLCLMISERSAAAEGGKPAHYTKPYKCSGPSDCELHETCFIDRCEDMRLFCLTERFCGTEATCVVRDHNVTCLCKPGFNGTQEQPCVQETAKFSKSEELSVEMKGIAQITYFDREMTLTIKTLDLGIEITSLLCFITPGESYNVTISLEGESSNVTLRHTGQTTSGWFHLPVSTDENQIYLQPNSEYKLSVTYDRSFYYRRMESPRIALDHFVLQDLPNCYVDQYCTPMIYVDYKTISLL